MHQRSDNLQLNSSSKRSMSTRIKNNGEMVAKCFEKHRCLPACVVTTVQVSILQERKS
jgi:hypothetical protein